ncbi:MAG: mechanosensitive ion channel family protein [Bacilli bacterium]|nr:mechanosensitive ion channel family protein [Bacilli bacterium]
MFRFKTKKEKTRFIVIASVILVFVLLGVLTPIIFKGTAFDKVISNSIGKFFNIVKFFSDNYVNLLESLAIIVFMWIINQVLKFVLKILTVKGNRSETIGKLLVSVVGYGSVIVALFLILSAWGVQTPTLLASAGILGLAISFGAQSLIEDIFAGLFIIFEKQYAVGDVIQVGDFRGTVTEIGIRVTKIEDINGDIKTINNSDVRGAINTSSCLSPAICDVSISYGADLEKVEEVVTRNLEKMKKEIPGIVEGPYYKGVQSLSDSAVVIRIYAKTSETGKYQAVRDMNRFMKVLFDNNKIEIPFPQMVIHMTKEEEK